MGSELASRSNHAALADSRKAEMFVNTVLGLPAYQLALDAAPSTMQQQVASGVVAICLMRTIGALSQPAGEF